MSDVAQISQELCALRQIIAVTNSPSDQSAFEAIASKSLLLASASYFERQVCGAIERAARDAGTCDLMVNFISKQALERKYHVMFDWDKRNINKFLSLFGPDYKTKMESEIKESEVLSKAMNDFIFINSQRNLLVHNNYASFALETAMDELWVKFESGKRLSDWLPLKLANSLPKKLVSVMVKLNMP